MRIIRGTHKGKKILPPKKFNSRPTTDFAKESLFNILDNIFYFDKLTVLDLFAGTGNISYEFISRGCESIVAVEFNKYNCKHIETNIEDIFNKTPNVINVDAYEFCKTADLSYKVIFADPPFSDDKIKKLPEIIFNNETASKSLFILEHSAKYNFTESPFFKETRRYGNVNFTFFEKK